MAAVAPSARAIARTCAFEAVQPHAHLRTHARAHRRSRRAQRPGAPTTRPSASRLWLRAARAGKAAHTASNVVTRAVFHAPMSALNADAA